MPTLDWIGKKAVVNHHREVPYRLLHCDKAKSAGDPDAGNLLVQGDNLEALKALLPYYAGKVKCIYIDPPYNTGNEGWVYNDNVNSPEIQGWLHKAVGKEAEDLSRHDKWLCMMYPRLRLLKEFLTEDGVLLVSIDDFEVASCKFLLNDIFEASNFIAQLVWDKTRKNDAKLFSVGHEYVLVYARSLSHLRAKGTVWREAKPGAKEIIKKWRELKAALGSNTEVQDALRKWYASLPKGDPSKALSRYKWVDEKGPWRDRDISWPGGGGPRYDLPHPVTGLPCKVPERGWGFATKESMQDQIDRGLVQFRADHTEPPIRKAYLTSDDEDEEAGLSVMPSVIHRQAQVAVRNLRNLFGGKKVFENPKDHEVIARLISYVSNPDSIILDAFAGSGTTAHAVMEANGADQGTRRFVLVEMLENVASDVTAERIKRVIAATDEDAAKGFRFCTLGEPLFDETGSINPRVTFPDLAAHIFFCETGSPIPKRADGKTPFIGTFRDRAVYLLYAADCMGFPSEKSGNVLNLEALARIAKPSKDFMGTRVVYGEGCTLPEDVLRGEGITFKQVPYQIEGI